MEECVFCQIANGQQNPRKIFEDESVVAFLSIRPINPGHLLVIPKNHIDEFQEMGEDLYDHVMEVVQRLARTIKTKLNPPRVGLWVHGFEVPHAHIHVIPLHSGNDIRAKTSEASDDELAKVASKLRD